ncbi:MAG: phosphoribosylformylglycinamidine cyclo-ligase [Spirochaetales bacterium]|nr:phosphoribosylformylglycinamidine cyclo-ligase [Spirochaetales bacterium]
MSEEALTYRSSGVDVEANLEANRRIQACCRRTYTEHVLTREGLFGGAIRLPAPTWQLDRPVLVGRLAVAEGRNPESISRRIARSCRTRIRKDEIPLGFLDYLAAARLDVGRAADLVEILSSSFRDEPKIPVIGGETAEMPDVFRSGAWEVVGAMFGIAGAQSLPRDRGRIDLGGLRALDQPALVFSMDGVGTKTKLGVSTRHTAGLALDIIHHSLDDILCQGARGLGMMLYVGCHRRDEGLIGPLLEAAERCCRANDLVLLDRRVAEKPSLYLPGEIDVCGAVVGAVEAEALLQGDAIEPGDVLIGLCSSGLHTNGYSLARKALLERCGMQLEHRVEELGCTLGQALLEPHRNYAPVVLPLLDEAVSDPGRGGPSVRGIAHITGGGLKDNLERILPAGVRADIRLDSWQPPPLFELIRSCGSIPLHDPVGKGMYESFNMGIGMVLVVAARSSRDILGRIRGAGQQAEVIGRVLALEEERAGEYRAEEGRGSSAANGTASGAAHPRGGNRPPASEERVRLL